MKVFKILKIIGITVLIIIIIITAFTANYVLKLNYDSKHYNFPNFSDDILASFGIDTSNEINIKQFNSEFIIQRLQGEDSWRYDSVHDAYICELRNYNKTHSIESLRNVCQIISLKKEQDYEELLKYYLLLFEAIKDDSSLEEEMGTTIWGYEEEYVEVLYIIDRKDECINFFRQSDMYFSDPTNWLVTISLHDFFREIDNDDFHKKLINVFIEYENEYYGEISDKIILHFYGNILAISRIIEDNELVAEYDIKVDDIAEKILAEID